MLFATMKVLTIIVKVSVSHALTYPKTASRLITKKKKKKKKKKNPAGHASTKATLTIS